MFYPRTVLPQLEKEKETPEIVVLTGMRQVGKTTLLQHLFEQIKSQNKIFLDLENPLHRKVFEEENYDNIWKNLAPFGINSKEKTYLFLDEIQNLPQVSQAVKYLKDHWSVKFFLTGSSSFYLKNLFPESLAGRKVLFELYPLTFTEFLIFKSVSRQVSGNFAAKASQKNYIAYQKLIAYYKDYLEFGGFPKVVLEENQERKKTLLQEVFTSYFEKDVKSLADFRDLSKVRDLLMLLAVRVGSKLDIVKLASELTVSRETIYNYLEFLQKTYFISLLPKHSASFDRQVAGGKKVFLCDTGIANLLGKVSQGQLLEESVFQTLRPRRELAYYDKEGRAEIDFVADHKTGLEVKLSSSQRDLFGLKRNLAGAKLKEGYLISLAYSEHPQVILATDL